MFSKYRIRAVVDAAEIKFVECFDTLALIKQGIPPSSQGLDRLFAFQPLLCEALMNVEETYHGLKQEKSRLIQRKAELNSAWFGKRMASIANYCSVLESCMFLGKSIGDAFAWFFYQKDRELLQEHSQHEKILHLPVGIGAKGELEFVKNIKGLGDALVIYHGTTTLLRLGDVSLVDCKNLKVVALGELKTGPESNGRITIILHLRARTDLNLGIVTTRDEPPIRQPQSKFHETLRRQIKRMDAALAKSQVEDSRLSVQVIDQMHIGEFTKLVEKATKRRAASAKIGDGLVMIAIRAERSTLSESYFDLTKHRGMSRFRGSELTVQEIVDPSAGRSNSLAVGTFYTFDSKSDTRASGMVPFFWWPISTEIARQIMFGRVLVVTVYNSLHLRRKLEHAGFTIKEGREPHEFSVEFTHEGRTGCFQGLGFMKRLVTNCLMQESAVVEMMRKATFAEYMKSIPKTHSAVVHINFQHFI